MSTETVIKVENVYKKFCRSLKRSLLYGTIDVSKNMLGIQYDPGILRKSEFWSIEDISFDLKRGKALGIIGQNGSGKTTLLRLINGIFPPDKGSIYVRGKIGALIAVGAGFHPHMTGRENIYLNGTILGMSKKEIESKFQDIIDFADIGDFLDAPVATYSSGMAVRLGFSIAIHSEPEIMLADEVLAVGDLAFVLKCYRKISEFKEKGGSLILVSHNMQLVRNTCDKVLWIDKGICKGYGDPQQICDEFENFMLKKSDKDNVKGNIINIDPAVSISKVEFLDESGKEKGEFNLKETLKVRIHYEAKRVVHNPIFTFTVYNVENIAVISNHSNYDGVKLDSIQGEGYVDFVIKNLSLKPTKYSCSITIAENEINNQLESREKYYFFTVKNSPTDRSFGIFNPFGEWMVKQ